MDYANLARRVKCENLEIFGAFHPDASESIGATLVLLGPREPQFWGDFKTSDEYLDGHAHAMDRWSARVIGTLASELDAVPHFPFGPPPYAPFFAWALRSGHAWHSPAGLLVHDKAGMMVSYRGALALPWTLDLPPAGLNPCKTCKTRPCLHTCPVSALYETKGYDVAACHAWLDTGPDCLGTGCLARRACPVSQGFPRVSEQSAFHMAAFHSENSGVTRT